MNLNTFLKESKTRLEKNLTNVLSDHPKSFSKLYEAMRYSCLPPGKCIRALLTYSTGYIFSTPLECLDAPAIAIEMIHAYSLVHDDLPAMDNADLRRGRPSCHKSFDEATAILVGDALQMLAIEQICNASLSDSQKVQIIKILARSSGPNGMVGGQMLDLLSDESSLIDLLNDIHKHKTGALLQASVQCGIIASNSKDENLNTKLIQFASHFGLAFQIRDDILDATESEKSIGKPVRNDVNKATYVSLLGIEKAQDAFTEHFNKAIGYLNGINKAAFLIELAQTLSIGLSN